MELHLLDDSHGSINFDLSTEFDIFPPCTASLEPTSHSNPTSPSPDPLVPLPPASLPVPGALLNLTVTHAVSPDSFTVRLTGEGLDVGDELEKFYMEEADEVSTTILDTISIISTARCARAWFLGSPSMRFTLADVGRESKSLKLSALAIMRKLLSGCSESLLLVSQLANWDLR